MLRLPLCPLPRLPSLPFLACPPCFALHASHRRLSNSGTNTKKSIKKGDVVMVTRDDGGYDSLPEDVKSPHPSVPVGRGVQLQ